MSLAHRAVRGAAIVLASSYTNMALGMVYGIVMARLLKSEHFGTFAGAMFFAALFDLRGKLGLDYAFFHKQPTTEALIATHWVLSVGAALITFGIAAIAAIVVSQLNYPVATAPIMIALAGAMIVEAAGTTAKASLDKELVFARSTLVITGALALSYLIAIGLAARSFTYWALVGQVVVNAAISGLGFWWAYRRLGSRPSIRFSFDRPLAVWMLKYGATLALGSIATIILLQFDNFLVFTFVGSAAAGYYVYAYKVAQWPTGLVTHIVVRASLPTYAKLQNDLPRLGKAFEMSLWLILMTALPIALAIFVTAPDFINLLYGAEWLPSALPLQFLIGYSVLRPLLDDTGALFTTMGQPQRVTIVLFIQAITLVIVATPLTLLYGSIGTALGVAVAFLVGIILTYRFVAQTLPINLVPLFIPPTLATLGSAAFGLWLDQLSLVNSGPLLLRVLARGGATAGMFVLIMLLLQGRATLERVSYIWALLRKPAG